MVCQDCHGTKYVDVSKPDEGAPRYDECEECGGTGEASCGCGSRDVVPAMARRYNETREREHPRCPECLVQDVAEGRCYDLAAVLEATAQMHGRLRDAINAGSDTSEIRATLADLMEMFGICKAVSVWRHGTRLGREAVAAAMVANAA